MSDKIIGIDLGTTNSVVAVREGTETKVIVNNNGERVTPSVVAFKKEERIVGSTAKRQTIMNPKKTIHSIKRFMGRRMNELKPDENNLPYKLVGQSHEAIKIQIGKKKVTAPEISAMILQYLKKSAEEYLGTEIKKAVITVPAYFNDAQRQATKDAGKIAGLEVMRIVNEPTAAALAYGLDKKKSGKIAVYDLGGGTFDISILDVSSEDEMITVLSTNGDTHLGGDDFDREIVNFILEEVKKEYQIDLSENATALQRIREEAEKAKKELSKIPITSIVLPFIGQTKDGEPLNINIELSQAKFESMIAKYIDRTNKLCRKALEDAEITFEDVDEVIMVGGSTRIPKVRELVKNIFEVESLNCSVNPDEVVALGAAIQGAILSGEINELLLLDVTPLTLGIATLGGVMTPLIRRNTTIPTRKTEVFSTAHDNQTAVDIHVLQGERPMASDNRTLGRFQLEGLPLAPRGIPKIEVAFDLDANGILNVSAKDLGTNKAKSIKVQQSGGISDAEIERMKKEAEKHSEEDKRKVEEIQILNKAESYIINGGQFLAGNDETLTDEQKDKCKKALSNLVEAKETKDIEKIKKAIEEYIYSQNELAKELYKGKVFSEEPEEGEGETIINDEIEDVQDLPTDEDLKDIEQEEDEEEEENEEDELEDL